MDLSSNVFKIIGGVGAASVTAIATGVGIDQNNQRQKALEEEKARQRELAEKRDLEAKALQEKLTKEKVIQESVERIRESTVGQTNWFGGGLYEFLDDQDIVFSVLKGDGSELKDIDLNFKKDLLSSNLNITVKVSISENSNQLKTSDSGKIKIEHLKALRGGNNWTWSCNIKFSPLPNGDENSSIQTYELKDKDKFFNENDGFFDVLKKDLTKESNGENKTKWKEIKKKFVKNCSSADKGNRSQSKLNLDWITFFLRPKRHDSSSEKNKLYFADKGDHKAKDWFGEEITIMPFQQ